jgi:hypothetical protein
VTGAGYQVQMSLVSVDELRKERRQEQMKIGTADEITDTRQPTPETL